MDVPRILRFLTWHTCPDGANVWVILNGEVHKGIITKVGAYGLSFNSKIGGMNAKVLVKVEGRKGLLRCKLSNITVDDPRPILKSIEIINKQLNTIKEIKELINAQLWRRAKQKVQKKEKRRRPMRKVRA